jgi:hypothetical protein
VLLFFAEQNNAHCPKVLGSTVIDFTYPQRQTLDVIRLLAAVIVEQFVGGSRPRIMNTSLCQFLDAVTHAVRGEPFESHQVGPDATDVRGGHGCA